MAGGKLTPRQKMINMMYLVLTALLALNVSKDILDALAKIDKGYSETITTVERQNQATYNAFVAAATENPTKAGPWKEKAFEVKAKAEDLNSYITKIRTEIEGKAGGRDEETGKLKRPDNREVAANYMLNPKDVGGEDGAKILKQKLSDYKATLLEMAGDDEELQNQINTTFDLSDQKVGEDATPASWEKATFEHFPLIAVLTFLSDIQADVRRMESETIEHLQTNIGKSDLKFTGVKAIVMPKSNYVTQGDMYEADVFLAAYDETQDPEIIINGNPLPEDQIVNGAGKIALKATTVGENKWAGVIKIKQNGEIKEFPVEAQYTVAPPSVVISPSKMNVLYRGVANPLEIGVPGVDPKKIRVSGPGVSGSNGNYVANVDKISGKEITISVSVEEEDGSVRPAGSKVFRLKGLPQATGMMYKKSTGILSKSAVMQAEIEAEFKDFPFDFPMKVVAFEVKLDGQPPMQVRGNRFDSNIKKYIEKAKPGSSIQVRNIKAVGPNNYRVNDVGNISIDLN
ncbi:MAG: gliding motility protein GldM [Bacteroidota bacterium]|nr:gliding motility protein GldM [Bacteroidota bacterium]